MKAKCINADSSSGSLKKGRIYSVRMKPHETMCHVFDVSDGECLGSWFKDRFEIIPDVNPLTLIDKPFGQLDRHTQIELFCAWLDGKQIEYRIFGLGGMVYEWCSVALPQWDKGVTYRLASESVPLTKDSIDWSHVDKKYKYLRRDRDGKAHLFTHTPKKGVDMWWSDYRTALAEVISSYKQGTESWENAGIDRPEES